MSAQVIDRDERTVAVENASYRWAYLLLTFGMLASVAYRSFALHQTSWDLLGLVVASGFVVTVLQGREHVLTRRSALVATTAIIAALIVGVALNATSKSFAAASSAYDAAAAAAAAAKK